MLTKAIDRCKEQKRKDEYSDGVSERKVALCKRLYLARL